MTARARASATPGQGTPLSRLPAWWPQGLTWAKSQQLTVMSHPGHTPPVLHRHRQDHSSPWCVCGAWLWGRPLRCTRTGHRVMVNGVPPGQTRDQHWSTWPGEWRDRRRARANFMTRP